MKKRFREEQIIAVLKERESGMPVKELIRKYGIAKQTFTTGNRSTGTWKSKKLTDSTIFDEINGLIKTAHMKT